MNLQVATAKRHSNPERKSKPMHKKCAVCTDASQTGKYSLLLLCEAY